MNKDNGGPVAIIGLLQWFHAIAPTAHNKKDGYRQRNVRQFLQSD